MGTNCVVSTTLGCIFCYKGCNGEKLQNAFTFVPPAKSYEVKVEKLPLNPGPGIDLVVSSGKLVYCAPELKGDSFYKQAAEKADVRFIRTSAGEEIPLVWLPHIPRHTPHGEHMARSQRYVLLHCHGNATDLGMMMGPFYRLSKHLGVDVVGVEYTGYGVATGSPSVRASLQDVEAAYAYLVAAGVPSDHIIVYGQSVGCGPAMRQVKDVGCPVFIMHGRKDNIIPFYHGYRLTQAVPNDHRWPSYFPPAAGHNDIIELDTGAYFQKLQEFLLCIMEGKQACVSQPEQVEMKVPNDDQKLVEPTVGPRDGRYQKLRHGNVVPGSSGHARDLQLT